LLRRNPVAQIERPTVTSMAPTELTPEAHYVLNTLVERQDSKRLTTIVALVYRTALRISEVATLRIDHCTIDQRRLRSSTQRAASPARLICITRPGGPCMPLRLVQTSLIQTGIAFAVTYSEINTQHSVVP
jgi:integrase